MGRNEKQVLRCLKFSFIYNRCFTRRLITLPPNVPSEGSAPRFSFAPDTLIDIRPKAADAPRTTADLMLHSGARHVHAISSGPFGDLEASRHRLLEMGYVDKRNFDEAVDPGAYDREKEENITLLDTLERRRIANLTKGKAYNNWSSMKEAREQALLFLKNIDLPVLPSSQPNLAPEKLLNADRAGGIPTTKPPTAPPSYFAKYGVISKHMKESNTASALNISAGLRSSSTYDNSSANGPAAIKLAIEVGRALKKVDRTLLQEWAKWCEPIIPANSASVMWDFFYPSCCDLHGMFGTEVQCLVTISLCRFIYYA